MRPVVEPPTRILFLTTQQPSTIKAEWPFYQNYDLPDLLKEKGALVNFKSWMDEDILAALEQVDIVTFLWCNEYYKYPGRFFSFLDQVDKSIKARLHAPRIVNPIELVRWNADKRYLLDMKEEGFEIPKTQLVEPQKYSVSGLHALIQNFSPPGSVVLKPSMSASSTLTRRIASTTTLNADDVAFLELCTLGGLRSSLVIQQFEPDIRTGEYSFIFVGPHLTHAMLKCPGRGEFRVQDEYGGSARLVDIGGLKLRTLQAVRAVFGTLQRRFGMTPTGELGYARIDGLITEDRPFVLMEIEVIEPHLWLETGKGIDRLLSLLTSA
ncbi:hypothetical protein BO94DRAFT_164610 [Aspergillus sclerotioniger CBS 115572]|uniref:ATP-grasp domain-containing protein n=1 Tax=Aspergillus sclerotioniger CBS 115572 TaxID=1450535 RepID=A0A317W257_9EURO|nr:hypothetical protein BO94DRAFT_164610 [Aspergillus sclerotioniger CBS 115572]PWY79352.1 hypothetical protein BO94DRAFT_164610 [Aspergillus sclerotioniger CBS 115572]